MGVSCCRDLARRGSDVTVFEARGAAGGALRHTLSPYRVSHDMVDEEVCFIGSLSDVSIVRLCFIAL